MKNLVSGLCQYSEYIYPKQRELFQNLAQGQKPHTMLITCADSRIDPTLVTQTKPGELFIMRNAGNIIPPYGASRGSEEAAVEFAVEGLGIQNIVVCGHSKCGAIDALCGQGDLSELPATQRWLEHAAATKKRMGEHNDLNACIEDNVLMQMQNLKTHPSVSLALKEGRMHLYAWVYHFEFGIMNIFHKQHQRFLPAPQIREELMEHISHFEM